MAEPVWYCIVDGQTIGPITRDQVADLAAGGKLRRSDYVWREGMADWLPAGQVPEVFGNAAAPAVPPTRPGPIPLEYAPSAGVVYAGFWLRLVAWLLDVVIIFVGVMFVSVFVSMFVTGRGDAQAFTNLLSLVLGWLYYALMESSPHQGTLGKLALGLKVTDLNGAGPISFGRATGRHFAKIVSWIILGIGFILAGLTARKQALHDMIAGCLVLRKR